MIKDFTGNRKFCQTATISKRKSAGFTLIELLIVIAIIGVLATLLMVNFVGVRQRARDAQRKSDLRQIQSALELYRADQGSYPSSLPSCNGSAFSANGTTYMQTIPCDPLTGTNYLYSTTASGGYTLVACLENLNDSQKDSSNNSFCSAPTYPNTASYTVTNP